MKVALDLGGSSIRLTAGGNPVQKLESQYERVSLTSRIFTDDILDKHSDFTILEAVNKEITNSRYVRGEAANFLRGVASQVDNNALKVDQSATYVNATHAIAVAVEKYGTSDNEEVIIGVCIPTSEFFSAGADRIKERLEGSHSVKFNLMDKVVSFTVTKVVVYPEGVVALADLFSDSKVAEILKSKVGIVIDAGRRSTDVTIMQNGRPIAGAARSLPIGGINLEALSAIELENSGYMVSGNSLSHAIAHGYITQNADTVDIGKFIQESKRILAGSIAKSIAEVLAARTMQLREISYVVYMGRCFNFVSPETSRFTGDLGDYLIKELKVNVTRINVQNNELANVNAVTKALARVAA